MEINKKGSRSILITALICISFYLAVQNFDIVLKVFSYLFSLIYPFVLGGAIAFIFNVPMKKIEGMLFRKNKKMQKVKRPFAYVITLLCFLLVIMGGMFIVIPELISTGETLVKQIPKGFKGLEKILNQYEEQWTALQAFQLNLNIDWDKIVQEIVSFVQGSVSGLLNSTLHVVSNVISAFTTGIIAFTFSIYILFQKEKLSIQMKKLNYAVFQKKTAEKIISILHLSYETFANFISGQCTESVILGILFFVVMSIFQMPYALLVGVLIAITALIPVFGAFIGCVVGVFLIAMVNPIQALWFLVIFLVLQQLEGNLIYPHVVGGKVGLPSFLVLVAVTIGGKVMGITGMLLFIPASSVLYSLLRDWMNHTLEQKNITEEFAPKDLIFPEKIQSEENKSVDKKKAKK